MRKSILALVLVLLSFEAAFSDEPCDSVAKVLSKSKYFKNTEKNGQQIGYVYFDDTPVGRWMLFDNGDPLVAKSSSQIVGRSGIQADGNKCVFMVEASERGLLGHIVEASNGSTIEFKIEAGDTDVFFKSSLLIPITDEKELAKVSKRFEM